jgi:Leucine-rich repeat (LRR) protein
MPTESLLNGSLIVTTNPHKKFPYLAISLGFLILNACSDYQLTLNEQVLYEPPTLFAQFKMADPALDTCVRQTIQDKKISKPGQLAILSCSNAGIKTLAGIETFKQLQELNINDNEIDNIEPLAVLGQLKTLLAKNNKLRDLQPLFDLEKLQTLDVTGMDAINCDELNKLQLTTLSAPEHCK